MQWENVARTSDFCDAAAAEAAEAEAAVADGQATAVMQQAAEAVTAWFLPPHSYVRPRKQSPSRENMGTFSKTPLNRRGRKTRGAEKAWQRCAEMEWGVALTHVHAHAHAVTCCDSLSLSPSPRSPPLFPTAAQRPYRPYDPSRPALPLKPAPSMAMTEPCARMCALLLPMTASSTIDGKAARAIVCAPPSARPINDNAVRANACVSRPPLASPINE